MMLYHGTSAKILDRLKREGIMPRAKSKGKGNWKHTVTSNKDAVYLTTAYPWHFAACAAKEEPGLILEIDRDELLPWALCPDEDFMEQCSRKCEATEQNPNLAPTDWSMNKRTMFYRKIARFNPDLADVSLEHMGTCAYYGTIPWSAVTRYVTVDWTKLHMRMYMQAVDSMVSALNYKILQDRHKAFVRWFFDDAVMADEITGDAHLRGVELPPELSELKSQAIVSAAAAMEVRDGLVVVNCRNAGV
jgi:hypothetical protein